MTEDEIKAANEELKRAYDLTFNSPSGQIVLLDLISFCKFRADIDTPIDEGKRRVALRIVNFTLLTPEQLQAAYRAKLYVKTGPQKGAISHDDRTEPQS